MCAMYGNILMVKELFKTVSPICAYGKARRAGGNSELLMYYFIKEYDAPISSEQENIMMWGVIRK